VTGGLSLLKAYLAAPLPDPFYYLEMDDGDAMRVLARDANSLVER
jgi:hypothetical protein